jgi:hypothetical protein
MFNWPNLYIYSFFLLTLLSKKLLFHSSFKSEKEVSYLKCFIKTNIIRVSIELEFTLWNSRLKKD